MSVLRLAKTILRIGRMAEPAPDAPSETPVGDAALTGSVQVRHVDAGSCNGCEIEVGRSSARSTTPSATAPASSPRPATPTSGS
jgi:hypothetical protein